MAIIVPVRVQLDLDNAREQIREMVREVIREEAGPGPAVALEHAGDALKNGASVGADVFRFIDSITKRFRGW